MAAGNLHFQIEHREDRVFIRAKKPGASTACFSGPRRFAYELETTPEVRTMNVSIDNPLPAPIPPPTSVFSDHIDDVADMILARAFLGTVQITPPKARLAKGEIIVRVQQVFRTKTSLYVHYTIENNGKAPYQVTRPNVFELQAMYSKLSLPSLAHTQLDRRLLEKLRAVQDVPLPVAHAESAAERLSAGDSTEGVIAIRRDLISPAVVQLVFDGGTRATFVL